MNIPKTAKYPWPTRKDRLNQPRVTRVEALRQLQTMMPLSGSAQRELQQSSPGSLNGQKATIG